MALLNPGIGDLGTYVNGTAITTGSIGNGQEGVIGSLYLPSAGVWVISASGWWPSSEMPYGYIYISRGGTVAGTGNQDYQFALSGIDSVSGPATLELKIVNWSGKTVSGITIGGFRFRAVKVGNV